MPDFVGKVAEFRGPSDPFKAETRVRFIAEAKTQAGLRDVPIHPAVKDTFARLKRDKAKGDYLLPRREGAKHPVDIQSKAFRRLRVSQGYDDDRLVFHSIRATVITMLERAGVPEHITQDIVGHERATLTGQTYSMKSIMEARAEAIAKLEYPS